MIDLYQGDCLDEMDKIPAHSVDMIFTDLPYGTTKNAWDVPLPLDTLWKQYRRVLKPGGAVLLFAQATRNYGHFDRALTINEGERYPRDVLTFSNGNNASKIHPTEKPVDLLEYMVRTYTDEDDTVLDSCMGSGSCGVACQHLGRNFIGIEKDPRYFEAARKRIADAVKQ